MNKINLVRKENLFRLKEIAACVALFLCCSCNEALDSSLKLTENYSKSEIKEETGHVLWVVMDGASGEAVREAYNNKQTPTIKEMSAHATYTFEGLADSKKELNHFTSERGWANLMTGVTTHSVTDDASLNEMTTPSIFGLLKQTKPLVRTGLYTSSERFHQLFGGDADVAKYESTDEAAIDATIAGLGNAGTPVSDFMVVQLNGVKQAGQQAGFYDDKGNPTTDILAAIKQTDNQLGRLMAALEARPNYRNEKWIVMVTSNYGGQSSQTGNTYFDKPDRNTFTMMYNSGLTSKLLQKPGPDALAYKYYTPEYSGSLDKVATVNDPTLFNFEDTGSYTVQFFYYSVKTSGESWITMVSKRPDKNGNPGWALQRQRNRLIGRFAWDTQWTREDSSGDLQGGVWHTVTVTLEYFPTAPANNSGQNRVLKIYLDGKIDVHKGAWSGTHFTTWNDQHMSNPAVPLTLGPIKGCTSEDRPFYITNLQFYDIALPEEFIMANAGKDKLDELGENYKYWDHLIGYWPCDREEDLRQRVLKDYSKYGSVRGGENAGRSDMTLSTDEFKWAIGHFFGSNLLPTPDDEIYKNVFNLVDLPFQTFQWLGLDINRNWGLEGIGWPLNYSSMQN